MRGNRTQQQMAFDLEGISRESVSSYETGRNPIPKDIASKAMRQFDDPRFALTVASEYTDGAWAPALDGPAADLYRTSVQTKCVEEFREAIEALQKAVLNVQPKYLDNFQKQDIEKSGEEIAEAITAANTYLMVVCKDYKISWLKIWARHKAKLIHKGFLRMVKGGDKK
ncbi:XRE family transcriptional regulator [Sporolactobacillus sp. THM7-7]|nr:XRE family transcriptional regulator [Sporolactobacillus sp. THM7-7]